MKKLFHFVGFIAIAFCMVLNLPAKPDVGTDQGWQPQSIDVGYASDHSLPDLALVSVYTFDDVSPLVHNAKFTAFPTVKPLASAYWHGGDSKASTCKAVGHTENTQGTQQLPRLYWRRC
jgi:hypothetical protein